MFKKIAIDLDNTILDFSEARLRTLNSILDSLHKQYTVVLPQAYNIRDVYKDIDIQLLEDIANQCTGTIFRNEKPIAGSFWVLHELKSMGIELVALTGRNENECQKDYYGCDYSLGEITTMQLNLFFPNVFSKVIYSMNKADYCIEDGISLLVDDEPQYITDCISKGVEHLCLPYVYNASQGYNYVKSLRDVPMAVKQLCLFR